MDIGLWGRTLPLDQEMMHEWCQVWSRLPPCRCEGSKPVTREVAYTMDKGDCQNPPKNKHGRIKEQEMLPAHWSWTHTTEVSFCKEGMNTQFRNNLLNWCSPPWTNHFCTIEFCRHTYVCSHNQHLQTQVLKSNQNSDNMYLHMRK
jgi:hypothetical protein